MDLNKYYKKAHSGDKVDNTEILQYIKSFKKVVLWGGSYLGKAVGKKLIDNGVNIDKYWDMRYEEIGSVNNVEVVLPFSEKDKDNTLIIFCIGNTAIMQNLLRRLAENGYNNVIRGDNLFMGLVCTFDKTTGINPKICNSTMCCRSMFCRRLSNIVKANQKDNRLCIDNVTLMINTKCSLKCKYCVAYMNNYPKERKRNIDTKQILSDIDAFFDSVSSVGAITIQGGEPFLHPDLPLIVKKLLEKNNYGVISIATNGIFKIDINKYDVLKDDRVNVSFSNYWECISEKQLQIFENNVDLIKKAGISYTVGVTMPEWTIPSNLYKLNYSKKEMIERKSKCMMPERCMQIMDGRLYPCLFGVSIHGIGVADYPQDYIQFDKYKNRDKLIEAIRNYIDKPYYEVCSHCGGSQGSTPKAGEQGYFDFINK